jgi:hypothetical protein
VRCLKECYLIACVILFFILFSLFLPVYDEINGFHNLITDNYSLTWYDGRSPLNFYLIKNIIQNNSISFPRNYTINNMHVENFYDLSEKNGNFYPNYSFLGNYVYALFLKPFSFSSDLELFKMMLVTNVLFFAIILIVFYYIQKILGLKIKYRLLSTLIAGIATSILIYSRYFFINDMLSTLLFLLLIYQILNCKKACIKNDTLFILTLLAFLIVDIKSSLLLIAFSTFFSYILIKNKLIKFVKSYLSIIVIITILLILLNYSYVSEFKPIEVFEREKPVSFITIFPNFIPALDYAIYGYHDPTSLWKLDRSFNTFYIFLEKPGNAIFLSFYGLFGSLFGPKGFVYNSVFLIFSIIGIFIYKEKEKKNILLASIILIILIYGLFHFMWYGGVIPRYVRFFNIPILFLTFFSFYYIQETFKRKGTNKKFIIMLFIILVILSTLNVISLAIRADWTYEHDANLVSYDLVLWPWYPAVEWNKTSYYLTSPAEQTKWIKGGEDCKPNFSLNGIATDPCFCAYNSFATRNIGISFKEVNITIKLCSLSAGGDGTIGNFYLDDMKTEIFIPSNSCIEKNLTTDIQLGIHSIKIESGKFGVCDAEATIWKEIIFKEL